LIALEIGNFKAPLVQSGGVFYFMKPLYEEYGFAPLEFPERFMEIRPMNSYKCAC